mgnify:CR=1 FL=1
MHSTHHRASGAVGLLTSLALTTVLHFPLKALGLGILAIVVVRVWRQWGLFLLLLLPIFCIVAVYVFFFKNYSYFLKN